MNKQVVINRIIPVAACQPHPENYNDHDESQIETLRESLRQFGQVASIVVQAGKRQRSYLLVAGHGVHEAAQLEGLKKLRADVIPASWSKTKVLAYLAADNETARRSRPDEAQLASIVAKVHAAEGEALARLAAGEKKALAHLLSVARNGNGSTDAEPQIDRAAELQKRWGTARGQLWELPTRDGNDAHRLLCGDSTVREDVERVMMGEKADIIFTDPPYGVSIGDKNKFLKSFKRAGRNLGDIAGDTLGKDELFDMLTTAFTTAREVALSDSCAVYVTSPQGGELGLMMMMMMMMSGLPVRHVLNWVKNQPTFSLGRLDYEYQHEPILYTWTKRHKHYGAGDFKTSVWQIDKPRASVDHPTMKPVELVSNALLNSSIEGQLAYEPFCGSGTCIISCENLGRLCRAIEIAPQYVAVALQRYKDAFSVEPRLIEDVSGKAKFRASRKRRAKIAA